MTKQEDPLDDSISVVKTATCETLTRKSRLTYQVGTLPDGEVYLRVHRNTGNGFFGAYQFTLSTWDWVASQIGRPDLVGVRPDLAAPSDQDRLAQALAFEVAGGGLRHWPVCGRFYG